MALTHLENNSVPDSRTTLTFLYDLCLRVSDASFSLSNTWREWSNSFLLQVYCSRRALLTACSTDELFSSENHFSYSLSRDSITFVRLSIKEPINLETADCIAAPTEGSKTPLFRLERVLASSDSLMLKCCISRPEGGSLTDNSYLYDTQLTYCVTETPNCITE